MESKGGAIIPPVLLVADTDEDVAVALDVAVAELVVEPADVAPPAPFVTVAAAPPMLPPTPGPVSSPWHAVTIAPTTRESATRQDRFMASPQWRRRRRANAIAARPAVKKP